jgi:hypothetical protein
MVKKITVVRRALSQTLKFVGYKTVYTWSDGMEEKEGFFEYKGKLWSNGDVGFGRKIDAETSLRELPTAMRKKSVVVMVPSGRDAGNYMILTRVNTLPK